MKIRNIGVGLLVFFGIFTLAVSSQGGHVETITELTARAIRESDPIAQFKSFAMWQRKKMPCNKLEFFDMESNFLSASTLSSSLVFA
jgi:hypothetical protein